MRGGELRGWDTPMVNAEYQDRVQDRGRIQGTAVGRCSNTRTVYCAVRCFGGARWCVVVGGWWTVVCSEISLVQTEEEALESCGVVNREVSNKSTT